jgi:hypothetical protein
VAKRNEKGDSPRNRAAPRAAGAQDFHPDYGYVRADLRRIAYLAGAFLSLLVVLSFIID